MTTLEACVLGIIQGLTEFLPISSTAHLKIVPVLLGWSDPGAAFSAVVQIGTLIAVVIYFWSDVRRLVGAAVLGFLQRRPLGNRDSQVAWMIAAGTIPIVICGLLLKDHVETSFRRIEVMASALIGLALILIVAEWLVKRRRSAGREARSLEQLTWRDALLIGAAQALALIPGTSRSGATITAGLFLGLSRYASARFSFLLSLPAVFAAGVYELYKERDALLASRADAVNLLVATILAGVVGYAAIAFLLRYLQRHSTWLFIVYRIGLGVLLLVLLGCGVIASR